MDIRTLAEEFRVVLSAAQAERPDRPQAVASPCGATEFRWQAHERRVMLEAVNSYRAKSGLGPVAEWRVAQAERSACGHSDYPFKFALYCAELALEADPVPAEAER